MMDCYHQIKKCDAPEVQNMILAEIVLKYPIETVEVQDLLQEDVIKLQKESRSKYFLAMDPGKFSVLHYKKA